MNNTGLMFSNITVITGKQSTNVTDCPCATRDNCAYIDALYQARNKTALKSLICSKTLRTFYCCELLVDCGTPPLFPGAVYGDFRDTRYQSTFSFGCKGETIRLTGESSKKTNIVTCMEDGTWDFGTLRCEDYRGKFRNKNSNPFIRFNY